MLEPRPDRGWTGGVLLYLAAAAAGVIAWQRKEWSFFAPNEEVQAHNDRLPAERYFRPIPLIVALAAGGIAFVVFGEHSFNRLNVTLWVIAMLSLAAAFWQPAALPAGWVSRGREAFTRTRWSLTFDRHWLLLAAALGLAVFFLTARIAQTPLEMISDHAEKLLDTRSVLNGLASTGFARSTGNEYIQVYLTAAAAQIFQTGISFLSLKIGTLLCGLFTLPFIYLLGRELANRRAGLIALAFAGIAYWPNVTARSGFSFILYPFFLAPALYFLVRGLRSLERGKVGEKLPIDQPAFMLAGLFLGLGLSGYSAFHVVPLLCAVGVVFYLLHTRAPRSAGNAIFGLVILLLFALFAYLPSLRYTVDLRETFVLLSLFRAGSPLPPITGSPTLIFFGNLWNALKMFAWDNGDIWSIAIARRPALDIVSGALFNLGLLLAVLSYLRRRGWLELLLLIAIPILLLPSILALAYPAENPALNRAAGALVPVFVLVGMALDAGMRAVEQRVPEGGARLAGFLALGLFAVAALQNHTLIFTQFAADYERSSWNTSEIGGVVRSFANLHGSPDVTWLVAYPYWVDSRLVMMNAGFPERDNAILPDQLANTKSDPRPKLFILNPQDQASLNVLRSLYPLGWQQTYKSLSPIKDFWLFFAPPENLNTAPTQTTP